LVVAGGKEVFHAGGGSRVVSKVKEMAIGDTDEGELGGDVEADVVGELWPTPLNRALDGADVEVLGEFLEDFASEWVEGAIAGEEIGEEAVEVVRVQGGKEFQGAQALIDIGHEEFVAKFGGIGHGGIMQE
jgi:hypothetical protein